RGSYGETAFPVGIELRKRNAYGLLEIRRQGRINNPLPDFRASVGQLSHVFGIERFETMCNTLIQACCLQEFTKGLRRGGKSTWNPDTGFGQLADHFT